MKKIKKQRLSLESTVIRKLNDQELGDIAGGCGGCSYTIIPILTAIGCGNCSFPNSGCVNKN
jgi:hypothetical protein